MNAVIDMWATLVSRAWCRIFGHRWSRSPHLGGYQVCTRAACRGRVDAVRLRAGAQ